MTAIVWAFVLGLSSASPAAADTKGPCTAGLASPGYALTNSDAFDTQGSAYKVDEGAKVDAGMFSPFDGGAFTYHRVQLEFAGVRWTVSEKVDSGTDTEWRETLNVDDYAAFGVGLYKVIGYARLAGGQDCIGIAYVKVTGRNPLTTAAGAAAAGATVAGVLAVGAASAGGAGPKKPEDELMDNIEKIAKEEDTQKELKDARKHADELRMSPYYKAALLHLVFCSMAALPALLLTGMAMVTEGGQPPSPPAGRRLPRLPWRPRVSAVSLAGGLLAGAGIVVLLQQFALVYPTLTVAIAGLAGAGCWARRSLPSTDHPRQTGEPPHRLAGATAGPTGGAGTTGPGGALRCAPTLSPMGDRPCRGSPSASSAPTSFALLQTWVRAAGSSRRVRTMGCRRSRSTAG